MNRTDHRLPVPSAELALWWYLPRGKAPFPVIVMAHGFAAVKELYLGRFAERFVQAGFAVAVFDHRGFGASGGEPRQEADPVLQARDYRHVITWVADRPEIDHQRIGIWGTSYSGGHVLQVGWTDRRVRCVVSQVPTISGFEQTRRRVAPGQLAAFHTLHAEERKRVARGESPLMRAVIPPEGGGAAVYDVPEAIGFYGAARRIAPTWRNEVTLSSLAWSAEYEPGAHIERISPTPLLMIVASHDTVTPTDLALRAYERALEPKRLVLLPGDHFVPYVSAFDAASSAAVDWFRTHMGTAVGN
jgi:fermentation-respiration switch protein FrsA (DUF1100 family)